MCHHYPTMTANSRGLTLHEQVQSNPVEELVCVCERASAVLSEDQKP